jgi:hypothetical protein
MLQLYLVHQTLNNQFSVRSMHTEVYDMTHLENYIVVGKLIATYNTKWQPTPSRQNRLVADRLGWVDMYCWNTLYHDLQLVSRLTIRIGCINVHILV